MQKQILFGEVREVPLLKEVELLFSKYLLRLCLLIFIYQASTTNAKAQWVSIPDSNFVLWLNTSGYSQCMNGNQLDTTCGAVLATYTMYMSSANLTDLTGLEAFVNADYIDISNNSLIAINSFPASLRTLIFNNNHLDSAGSALDFIFPDSLKHLEIEANSNILGYLPPLPNGLEFLDASYNTLWSAFNGTFPDSLQVLNCSNCAFSGYFFSPPNLQSLYCGANQIDSLAPLSTGLQYLDCSLNALMFLPALPNSLTALNCYGNLISNLPQLPAGLLSLTCSNNLITNLPALPASLVELNCSDNRLSAIPGLPAALHILWCGTNTHVTALPVLPLSLTYLDCEYDSITVLPALPPALRNLICNRTLISQLPALPASLQVLNAGYCRLTSLTAFPDSLSSISIEANQLTSLSELPAVVNYLSCAYNANLSCLPQLKRIGNFYFNGTAITCLPNYGTVAYSYPVLDTIPLCNMFNNTGCPVFWNLSGKTYFDSTGNCQLNTGDVAQKNIHLNLYENGTLVQQTFSGGEGFYSFDVDPAGVFQTVADTANLPFSVQCPANDSYNDTLSTTDSLHYNKDFAFVCKNGFDVGVWSTVGVAHPARYTGVTVDAADIANFFGATCAAGATGTVTITLTGPVTYVSAVNGTTPPSTIAGNTITWNIADFGNLTSPFFSIGFITDTFATMGSSVCVSTVITTSAGDYNLGNNTNNFCFAVTSAYDPNEKEVYPAGNIDTAQKWLTYTIHFQNTGTAEAQHIYVTDTLDSNVDPASFQLLAYSHQPMVQIKENAVRFNFPNINLPDSNTNEALSHGYVQYKVKLKESLPVGTNISNTAFIYFDFNSAVVTNTTSNTISNIISHLSPSLSEGEGVMQIQIQPNPASSSVNVFVSESMIGSSLTVYDVTGRKMAAVQLETRNTKLETSRFANGVYFVTLENKRGRLTKKLIIQK